MSKNQRLNASITIGSVLDQSVRRNIGFLKSGLSSVGNEIKDVERKQRELGAHSGVIRPPIPIASGHPYRFNPATQTGASGHP